MDKINLLAAIASHFTDIVETNREHIKNNNITLSVMCNTMNDDANGTPVTRIAMVDKMILHEQHEHFLHYDFESMVHEMSNTSALSSVAVGGDRQWFYQMCTQMGYFQTSDDKPHIFGTFVTLQFYIEQCREIFYNDLSTTNMGQLINNTNIKYGALRPQNLTNVLSVQGSADPWHIVGITKPVPDSVQVLIIPGTSHCADLYPSHSTDLPQLIMARDAILSFIKNVLGLTDDGSSTMSSNPSLSYLSSSGSSFFNLCPTKCDSSMVI